MKSKGAGDVNVNWTVDDVAVIKRIEAGQPTCLANEPLAEAKAGCKDRELATHSSVPDGDRQPLNRPPKPPRP